MRDVLAFGLLPLVVIAVIVMIVAALVGGRGQPVVMSSGGLLRAYLYVGSFAGVIATAIGLVSLLNAVFASLGLSALIYGGDPSRPSELDRRRSEDLVRGLTFVVFGAGFWLVHWLARNRVQPGDQGALLLAYLFFGTAVFGVATLIFLPNGTQQAINNWILLTGRSFRQGVGDSLTPGIVSLALWLAFLRGAVAASGGLGQSLPFRPPGTPGDPSPAGVPTGPGPVAASAAAETPRRVS